MGRDDERPRKNHLVLKRECRIQAQDERIGRDPRRPSHCQTFQRPAGQSGVNEIPMTEKHLAGDAAERRCAGEAGHHPTIGNGRYQIEDCAKRVSGGGDRRAPCEPRPDEGRRSSRSCGPTPSGCYANAAKQHCDGTGKPAEAGPHHPPPGDDGGYPGEAGGPGREKECRAEFDEGSRKWPREYMKQR